MGGKNVKNRMNSFHSRQSKSMQRIKSNNKMKNKFQSSSVSTDEKSGCHFGRINLTSKISSCYDLSGTDAEKINLNKSYLSCPI